ncbi:hypothetical protein CDD81_2685 [Ophiocordyceps australis]|uniref:Folic acid synthesis protein FOL1 n=1 Tax=Ophiocordyceps australis TaxID=1399860 RepID=A0A2C5YCC5_9HYPO|nr:hypothetical protein CDD81_2685 [Ophiocordyceps australis]
MELCGIRITRTSSLWETEPMYVLDQANFINGVCEVETELEPLALLDQLQAIEKGMGRVKLVDKGPRNIDLDILLFGDEAINDARLIVPHAGMHQREFVLRPLAELVASKPLYASRPWKLVQDYLNELAQGRPLSTVADVKSVRLTPLDKGRKTHIMGIVNMTPDSFSDGGCHKLEQLAKTIGSMLEAGATMIDVGGQSTAPGRPEVTADEETARVVPAIQLIRSMTCGLDTVISIDTYRASVAQRAVASGADVINDVSAGQLDADMLATAARLGKTMCLMHMRGTPRTMTQLTSYPDGLVATIASELLGRVAAAQQAGIRRWRIMVDPGLGFAKTTQQNMELLRDLDELRRWPGLEGLPWLVGASRKSFVGQATGVEQPSSRIWGTAAAVAAAVQGGADVIRVHDVPEMAMVAAMSDRIWRC